MLTGLLRRPFAELYLTHPGTALRLSAAIFTTIIHDRIAQSWKTRDSRSRSIWEQVAVNLLAGVEVGSRFYRTRIPNVAQTAFPGRITWKLTTPVGNVLREITNLTHPRQTE